MKKNKVTEFQEKPRGDNAWINGGFFVFSSKIFDYIPKKNTVLEKEPLEKLAKKKQLMAYHHTGFWQNMDTVRDKNLLEDLWNSKTPPWKLWK